MVLLFYFHTFYIRAGSNVNNLQGMIICKTSLGPTTINLFPFNSPPSAKQPDPETRLAEAAPEEPNQSRRRRGTPCVLYLSPGHKGPSAGSSISGGDTKRSNWFHVRLWQQCLFAGNIFSWCCFTLAVILQFPIHQEAML